MTDDWRGARLHELLALAVRDDAARPLLTFYDDATGERAELSVATFGNWVAKTANFLRDSVGIDPGERILIRLPCHWQGAVWLSACWGVGAVATPVRGDGRALPDAALTVVAADDDQPPPEAGELVVLGLGPLGLPRPHGDAQVWAYPGVIDYDREIHAAGDRFVPLDARATPVDDVVLQLGDLVLTERDLLAKIDDALRSWEPRRGERVLGGTPLDTLPAILAMLLVPLVAGTTAVLCRDLDRHRDLERLIDRAAREHVAAILAGPGLEPTILPDLARL